MRWKIGTLFILILVVIIGYFFIVGSNDFEIDNMQHHDYVFVSKEEELSATLFIPERGISKQTPVALLIHGDGPQDRTSAKGYLPLINYLVEQGIAVFSWDKKGVGASKGNWLHQSIKDRAIEAKDAFNFLSTQVGFAADKMGYLGFSQAGWVIPKASTLTDPAFSIIIGGAVNWLDQGDYLTKIRLEKEGFSQDLIAKKLDSIRRNDIALFTDFNANDIEQSGIEKDRFLFIARNLESDATQDLLTMKGPLLALWGEDDLNVPAEDNAQKYREIIKGRKNYHSEIKIYPQSTHGLLKAAYFNYQLTSQWPTWKKGLFVGMGRKAYTATVLSDISNFILEQTQQIDHKE